MRQLQQDATVAALSAKKSAMARVRIASTVSSCISTFETTILWEGRHKVQPTQIATSTAEALDRDLRDLLQRSHEQNMAMVVVSNDEKVF